MTDCQNETLLQAWLDGELSAVDADAFRSHLAACHTCAARVREAEEALALIGAAWRSHSADRMATERVRARIEDAVTLPPAAPAARHVLFSRWGVGAAAALAIGILGVFLERPEAPGAMNPPERDTAREALAARRATWLESQTSRHLERAQLLLRSIRNTQAVSASELHYERALSRELVIRNRLLRRRAERKEDAAAADVLVRVEPLLVDIANLPDQAAAGEIAALQSLIQTQGIIAELRLYASMNGA
jgi:hypothetical protein